MTVPSGGAAGSASGSTTPYGPNTAAIRRFLVKLAALELPAHDAVVARYAAEFPAQEFAAAELMLGEIIERSGRSDARDALAGPLLQLVRDREAEAASGSAPLEAPESVPLDPIAEPALAALLALLVCDLLPPERLAVLYAPFDESIPLQGVLG
jgi:hypothetical protein